MTETQLKQSIHRHLKSIGAFYMKISDRFSKGVPDEFVAYNGRAIWFEFKTEKGRVEPMQEYNVGQIKARGCEAYIVRSLDEVKKILASR